jgi:hypothetical protein
VSTPSVTAGGAFIICRYDLAPLHAFPSDFAGRTVGLAIDPAAPDFLYAQVDTDGLYESADRGGTWHRLGQGPDHHYLSFSLGVDRQDPRRIYIGSSGGGLLAFTKRR